MCILCVIQKWSRRIATMLPWLVIPLIGLWALSQLLPPAFRFEITSPRLACVFVLLVTLFWYEILMPKLSAWRVRRNARLRERKRFEAIELQKLKKTATRRCRNCLTPYREQNPAGGKFMCSYCGHISKRPVLDLSIPNGLGVPNSGILKDLGGGKSGNVLNGKVWSDNGGLMCGQEWLDNGYWVGGSFPQKASYWRKHGGGVFFGRDDHFLAEKSYSHVLLFAGRALTATLLGIMWVWRKIFRVGSSGGDALLDAERKRMGKRGENGANFQECRGEKARKKAEEKRQAKLVKEQEEEEDRKQREEVLRLVDERRRSRDEKLEVDKDSGKGSTPAKDNDNKKEAEKKRQLKKKERDRGSSKSNSDAEELEKRADKESERNGKSESGRLDHCRHVVETVKSSNNNIIKGALTNNNSRGAGGTKYFDRVKGNIMSSSRAFTGHVKGAMNSVAVGREHRFNGPANHHQTSVTRREISQPERLSGKSYFTVDDKNANLPVHAKAQPCEAPKKTWRQLFTRSATVRPSSDSAVMDRPNGESLSLEVTSPPLSARPVTTQPYDNPINFGLPSPFPLSTNPCGSVSSKGIQMSSESKFPINGEALPECLLEESDIFEDPCYVPDPVSLLGPVSESLDNFQLNLGFVTDMGSEKPSPIQNIPISSEVARPSPIEAPASRLKLQDERHASSFLLHGASKAKDVHSASANGLCNGNENGTWQMWNTSPLGPDGLGLSGGPASWLLSPDFNRSNKEEIATPLHQKTMASLFTKDEHIPSGTLSPHKVSFGSYHNGETYGNPISGGTNDPWLPNALFGQTSDSQGHFTARPSERTSQDELTSGSPISATNHPFELSSADRWHKVDWTVHGTGESTSKSPVRRPPVGVVYSSLDVQSIW